MRVEDEMREGIGESGSRSLAYIVLLNLIVGRMPM